MNKVELVKLLSNLQDTNGGLTEPFLQSLSYININWIKNNIFKSGEYCPGCYSHNTELNNFKSTGFDCNDCGWRGDVNDLLTEEEAKCRKRTKLIDKFLDDN